MYEIWLMLNIAYEMALAAWPWLLGLVIVWLLLMARAWRSGRHRWRASLPGAAALAALAAILTFFLFPGWVDSSLSEMKYWVDWGALLGLGAAGGAVGLAFAWPLLATLSRRSPAA